MSDTIIRVDSAQEQYAYLTATFGEPALWQVESQTWSSLADGEPIEIATLGLQNGDSISVHFGAITPDDDSFGGPEEDEESLATEWLDTVMEAAVEFSKNNPPHHPGTIARFPVPAAGYAIALSVPMGLIAVDGTTPGLYAPPRIVALGANTLEPIGVGEFPDFDPEFWPPDRLADWPLDSLRMVSAKQLQGTIQRFSACWSRVVAAWFAQDTVPYRHLATDIHAALAYRALLDAPTMGRYYERMNPVFASWIKDHDLVD